MNNSAILKASLSALGVLALSARAEAAKKPNVVFIFSDDQRYASLGVTGDPVTQTPNLDGLAKQGVLFNNAHITSPISGPSRANIITSQWERKNQIGFTYVSKNAISREIFHNSFLYQLKQAGYSTAFIGKHHTDVIDGKQQEFKQSIDFCQFHKGHLGFYPPQKKPAFSNWKNKTQIEGLFESFQAYMTQSNEFDYFFENADPGFKDHLKKRDPNKPFCAWINFNLPHAASLGGMGSGADDPEYYKTLYQDKLNQIPLPEGYPQPITLPENVYAEKDLMKYYITSNKSKLLSEKVKMNRAVYAIDLFVGNVRKLLKSLGEDENTIIIFCADNGLYHGEHGLGGKSLLYQEASHVPMIVYNPMANKNLKGKVYDQFVVGQDIPATILDYCGVAIPDTYQGKSMKPILEGKNVVLREYLFLENLFTDQGYPRQEAVKGKKYKYTRFFSKENDRKKYLPYASIQGEEPIYEELFDTDADPNEMKNLAYDAKYKKILDEYRAKCKELVSFYAK